MVVGSLGSINPKEESSEDDDIYNEFQYELDGTLKISSRMDIPLLVENEYDDTNAYLQKNGSKSKIRSSSNAYDASFESKVSLPIKLKRPLKEIQETTDDYDIQRDLLASYRKKKHNTRIKRSLSADAVKIPENKMF